MNPKLLVLLNFAGIFLLYCLLGLAFWPLALDSQTDMTQNAAIRFLASLVYYPTDVGFGFASGILCTLILGCGMVVLKQPVKALKSFISFTVLIEFLFHYFFWVFSIKYAPIFAETIRTDFTFQTIIRCIIVLISFLGLWLLKICMQKKQINLIIVPHLQFECPHCHTQYMSNVKFCLKCNQFITIEEKK